MRAPSQPPPADLFAEPAGRLPGQLCRLWRWLQPILLLVGTVLFWLAASALLAVALLEAGR